MSNKTYLKEIIENIQSSKGSETVYGDPIEQDGKTIITVTKIQYGFGGGSGGGDQSEASESNNGTHDKAGGHGMGFGGGVRVFPVGVIELTETDTRFIPINDNKRMLAAFVGGIFASWLLRKIF